MVIKFDFTKRDIVMMAAFLALMVLSGFLWLAGIVVGAIFHGILWGIILVIAAIVIGKKYTILVLGLIYTIINVSLANMYGGALTGLNTFAGALVLELIIQMASPYASDLKLDLVGIFLFGLVSRTTYALIIIYIYGMVLPLWAIIGLILPHLITFPIGGYLGYKIGNKVKNVIESV